MCQLNLYIVPKTVPQDQIINIFQRYNLFIEEHRYHKLDYFDEGYSLFASKGACDCGSIISKLQEEKVDSFEFYKVKKKQEDVEKLNRIKELKASKDYKKKVKEFTKQRDKFWETMDDFSKHIHDFETKETERIFELKLQIVEYDFSDFYEQFNNLNNAIIETLKIAKEIYIYPFWQNDEPLELKGERQVILKNLKIEDLVFIPYNNLLKVTSFEE